MVEMSQVASKLCREFEEKERSECVKKERSLEYENNQIYRIGVLLFLKFNGDEMELTTCGRITWTLGFRAFQNAPRSDENDRTDDEE